MSIQWNECDDGLVCDINPEKPDMAWVNSTQQATLDSDNVFLS